MRALLLALLVLAPGAVAPSHPEMVGTRESVLPPPVSNVTQDPWRPARGEDVAVYVALREGWTEPAAVLLRHCRVEPDYACWPTSVRMRQVGDSPIWAGVLPWDGRFMKGDTVHVGYNLSIVYANGTEFEAPTGNYNAPPSFPVDSGGRYFFYALHDRSRALDAASGVPLLVGAVLLGAALLAWRLRTRGSHGNGGSDRAP